MLALISQCIPVTQSTFRSTFSAKTAYTFKVVDKPEQLDV